MERLHFAELVLEAFVHATESRERVEQALVQIAPGARVERQSLSGHFGQPLFILRARVKDPAAAEAFVERLFQAAGPELWRTAARRIDEQGRFFARLDKQAAAGGAIALSTDPENDVIKLTAKLRVAGGRRQDALAAFQARFAGGDGGRLASEEE